MSPRDRKTQGFEPPTPGPATLSGEHVQLMHEIAQDEARAAADAHESHCQNEGPVCRVWEEIGKMEARLGTVERAFAGIEGAAKSQARTMKLLAVAITVISLGFQVKGYLDKREAAAVAKAQATAKVIP
jgi:hypothetical protein